MVFLVRVNDAAAAEENPGEKCAEAVVHQVGQTNLPLFGMDVVHLTDPPDLRRIRNGIADHKLVSATGNCPHVRTQLRLEHCTEQNRHQPGKHRAFALQHYLLRGKDTGIQQDAIETGELPVSVRDASGDLFPYIIGK